MMRQLFFRETSGVVPAAMMVAAFGFVSRVLGLLRDRFLAARFGAGDEMDIYFAAFKIPDFIYNVLILGAISAVLIPIFLDILHKDRTRAFEFLNLILNNFLLIVLVCVGALMIFAPWIVSAMAPGFRGEKLAHTIALTRIMLLSPLFLGISNIVGSALQAMKRFFVYSLAPIFYNLGIIAGIFFLVPVFGIRGLAVGVVFGAFLHLVIQIPAARHLGFSYAPAISFSDPHLKKAVRLMIPRSLAIVSSQINLIVIVALASLLPAGSVAVVNFANNLQSVVLGLFGIPFAIAVFPVLSLLFTRRESAEFSLQFSRVLRKVLFLTVPASFVFVLLRAQIVRLVLGAGQFSWSDTQLTAAALGLFALSIFLQSMIPLFLRGFYAMHNTLMPFFATFAANLFNIACAVVFVRLFRYPEFAAVFSEALKLGGSGDISVLALPLSFSLASALNVLVLYLAFKKYISATDAKENGRYFYKILFISVVTYFCMFWALRLPVALFALTTFWAVLVQAMFALIMGGAIFLLLSQLLHVHEAREILTAVARFNKKIFFKARIEEPMSQAE